LPLASTIITVTVIIGANLAIVNKPSVVTTRGLKELYYSIHLKGKLGQCKLTFDDYNKGFIEFI
jgi:hypothetical protein